MPNYREHVSATPRTMLLETARGTGLGRACSLFFERPVDWLELTTLDDLPRFFAAMERALTQGYWVAGFFAYECGYHWEPSARGSFNSSRKRPLAVLGVYRTPEQFISLAHPSPSCGLAEMTFTPTPAQYQNAFQQVQDFIAQGDTYQVNLTGQVHAASSNQDHLLFAHMMQRQPVEFGAMLHLGDHVVLSASPELFFELRDRDIKVRPMKGTAPRGLTPDDDDRLARELAADEKNRAENVMIVDLLRNDLGRIAEMGSVSTYNLFAIERHPSLLQMTSEVTARLRPEITFYDVFRAIFPSGSIVGAPKVRTMQIIQQLEKRERGVYTGCIGYFAPDRSAVFSVAIRTVVSHAGTLTMGVGSGVIADSEVQAEYNECLLKAGFLLDRSFGLIETMRWECGCCLLLDLHMDRLEASATCFGFSFDRTQTIARLQQYAAPYRSLGAYKLRLVLDPQGNSTLSASPLPQAPEHDLRMQVWPLPVHSRDTWLHHKTTNRRPYDKALEAAQRAGCVDALLLNEQDMVTEGAIHSIFVRHGATWRTPPLSSGLLPGVYRTYLLRQRPDIIESDIHISEMFTADELCITNALRGSRQVTFAHEPLIP